MDLRLRSNHIPSTTITLFVIATATLLGGPPAARAAVITPKPGALSAGSLGPALDTARAHAQEQLRKSLDSVVAKESDLWSAVVKDHPGTNGSYDGDQTKAFREALAKSWVAEIDKARSKLGDTLESERLATLDLASADDPSLAPLNGSLRELEKDVLGHLKQWTMSQAASRLASLDPGDAGAKAGAATTREGLDGDLVAEFAARWSTGIHDVVAKYSGKTTASASALEDAARKATQNAEDTYLAQLKKDTGFSPIVRCVYSADTPGLACAPDLLLNAESVSTILVRGLPSDRAITITAESSKKWIKDRCGAHDGRDAAAKCSETGLPDPKTYVELDPYEDSIVLRPPGFSEVTVSVFKRRKLHPIYGAKSSSGPETQLAFARIRRSAGTSQGRRQLAILVAGAATNVEVCVAPKEAAPVAAPSPSVTRGGP